VREGRGNRASDRRDERERARARVEGVANKARERENDCAFLRLYDPA
jgi:hypothetical protein